MASSSRLSETTQHTKGFETCLERPNAEHQQFGLSKKNSAHWDLIRAGNRRLQSNDVWKLKGWLHELMSAWKLPDAVPLQNAQLSSQRTDREMLCSQGWYKSAGPSSNAIFGESRERRARAVRSIRWVPASVTCLGIYHKRQSLPPTGNCWFTFQTLTGPCYVSQYVADFKRLQRERPAVEKFGSSYLLTAKSRISHFSLFALGWCEHTT